MYNNQLQNQNMNEKLQLLHSISAHVQNIADRIELIVSQSQEIVKKELIEDDNQPTTTTSALPCIDISRDDLFQNVGLNDSFTLNEQKIDIKPPKQNKRRNTSNSEKNETVIKRNKQQRQFNTYVRESINQILGPDFMRTHDVQDIDSSIMEMIKKEAVSRYLPENIRPRRAWHLAKASLRTLKRTLNNRKQTTPQQQQQQSPIIVNQPLK